MMKKKIRIVEGYDFRRKMYFWRVEIREFDFPLFWWKLYHVYHKKEEAYSAFHSLQKDLATIPRTRIIKQETID